LVSVRLDKWLWAARFFKTRGLSQTAIEKGHVLVNDESVKVARQVKVDDLLTIESGDFTRTVTVLGLSETRGSAPIAQLLYEESAQSIAQRNEKLARRKLFTEPAEAIKGRPTKRDRRELGRASGIE
jgi:ribosome-associated heat shock protein Hsp15